MSKQAQLEKEKGNSAFKAGDYPGAVGHYSAAIIHDRQDFTLPLNRAAAYLKLGKYDDAERDCTTTLALKQGHAKALFRRGQARSATLRLQEAEDDLKAAAQLEPSNASITQELAKVSEALKIRRASKGKQPMDVPPVSAKTNPKRRRVPITIIDDDAKPLLVEASPPKSILKKSSPAIQEVRDVSSTTQPKVPAPTQPVAQPTTSKPNSKSEVETKPVRVGGGIFRANGSQTVFPTREVQPSTAAKTSSTKRNVVSKPPANLFDLTKVWEMCATSKDRFHLLTTIPPSQFPAFFQSSLEPSLLTSILRTFLDVLEDDVPKTKIVEYLNAFGSVPRFPTLILFLSNEEKGVARSLLSRIGIDGLNPIWGKIL